MWISQNFSFSSLMTTLWYDQLRNAKKIREWNTWLHMAGFATSLKCSSSFPRLRLLPHVQKAGTGMSAEANSSWYFRIVDRVTKRSDRVQILRIKLLQLCNIYPDYFLGIQFLTVCTCVSSPVSFMAFDFCTWRKWFQNWYLAHRISKWLS